MNAMKKILSAGLVFGMTALTGCATGADHAPAYAQDTTVVSGSETVLVVQGMSCPMCASNIDTELKEVAGVQSVDVNLDNGEVTVGLFGKQRPTVAELAAAIERTGFTLREVRTP